MMASTVDIGFHWIAVSNSLPIDTDGEGLWDAFEDRNGNGVWNPGEFNWQNADTDTNGLPDLQQYEVSNNVQVNDPAQDYGNDQNTQNETDVLAFGNTVITAYVDSNLGVAGYGEKWADFFVDTNCDCLSNYPLVIQTPQFIGWARSRDGGLTFVDQGSLPLLSNVWAFIQTNEAGNGCFVLTNLGNAGDPGLARDKTSGVIYLVGNPQRPSLYYPDGTNNPPKVYVPLWRSTNHGESFLSASPKTSA
jgi:hypothetical protein